MLGLAAGLIVLLGAMTWARGTVLPFLVGTCVAESGSIERSFEAEAVIVRKESVYVTGISGRLRLMAQEGERVRTGTPVAEVSNPQSRKEAEDRLADIERRIQKFDEESSAKYVALWQSVESLDQSVTSLVKSVQRAYSTGDRAAIPVAEADLSAVLEKRASAKSEIGNLEAERRDLETEMKGVQTLLDRSVTVLECEAPGTVSFSFDGCEKEFSTLRLKDVSARAVITAQPKAFSVIGGQEARAGEPVFRVVQDDEWYLAVAFPSNRVPELGTGGVRVRLPETGEKLWNVRVSRLDTGPPGGHAVMVLEAGSLPAELLSVRKTKATVITRSTQGVLIPRSAMTTLDGKQGVYTVYKTMAQFKPVQVKAQDRDKIVVDGILPGTEVVDNPWLVREGRRVK